MSDITVDGFNASPLFKDLSEALQDDKIKQKAISGVKATLVLTLKNKEGKEQSWLLDLKKMVLSRRWILSQRVMFN